MIGWIRKRRLINKQVSGLYMIRDGMNVQLDVYRSREAYYRKIGREIEAEKMQIAYIVLSYHLANVELALQGELYAWKKQKKTHKM